MQPSATDVLNGVKNIIVNIVLPELQTEQARQQVMYSTILIDHVIARWEIERPLMAEEHAELRGLLTQALGVVDDPRIREALAGGSDAPLSPKALATENERMRRLVPVIARLLPEAKTEPVAELDAAIRAYIRNQHLRDRAMVQVGELAW